MRYSDLIIFFLISFFSYLKHWQNTFKYFSLLSSRKCQPTIRQGTGVPNASLVVAGTVNNTSQVVGAPPENATAQNAVAEVSFAPITQQNNNSIQNAQREDASIHTEIITNEITTDSLLQHPVHQRRPLTHSTVSRIGYNRVVPSQRSESSDGAGPSTHSQNSAPALIGGHLQLPSVANRAVYARMPLRNLSAQFNNVDRSGPTPKKQRKLSVSIHIKDVQWCHAR